MKKKLFTQKFILLYFALVLFPYLSYSQVPTCDPIVPYHFVNLSGNPGGTWVSPSHERKGKCCSVGGAEACTSFEVILDANAVAVSFNIVGGAMPSGSLFYQVSCGPQIPVGQKICLSGVGPHRLTFCKPGNNENTYSISSISKPVFPSDTTVRIGCSKTLPILGITASSVGWTSVYPGVEGQYNSYLSCTNCISPTFTPIDGAPAYIDYKICGFPIVNNCGYTATICDTVRINIKNRVTGTISPSPASFCQAGPGSGVTLTANPVGGNSNYTYIWRNSSSNIVGTNQNYFATVQGNFTVEIRDGLYNSSTCPSTIVNVSVTEAPLPIVYAGADQTVCATDARANLDGQIQNASGGIWSGGNGTFSPNSGILTATYWPTNAEIASGSINLILTSNVTGNACPQVSDIITVTFPPALQTAITSGTMSCSGSTTMLSATVSGGMAPYSYSWNTGSTSTSISAPPGTFCVTVTDNLGCNTTECKTITVPAPLAITMSSTNVTNNGGSNGSATAGISGGVSPYTYLWSNGATIPTITGLSYGVYTITVTDSRGCAINGSIVVNEPRCLSFNVTINNTDLACYGDNDASATAIVTGGTGPYSYLWDDNNNQNTPTASNISDGTFTVYVTDATGCITSRSVTINMPSPIINTFTYSDATNFSGNNGSATANPFGGKPAYTYSWGNGASTQTINNLTPGKYYVNITDTKGCIYSDSIIINKDSCSNLRTSVISTSPSCFGSSNGSAAVFVNIGTAPYQYLWSNGATTNSVSGLSSGTYSVTVTDATGCFSYRTFNVVQPAKLSAGLSPTAVICYGQNNGTIETMVSGGTYPYSFSWSNGSNTEDLIYLAPGNYSVNILDAKGCAVSGSAVIVQPAQLSTTYASNNPTCNAGSDGSIDLTVTGGMIPYFYLWNNGTTTQDLTNISLGIFSLNVTDANGCNLTTALIVNVGQPTVVAVDSAIVPCPAPGSNQTLVVIIPSGGNGGPYRISFNNGSTFQSTGDYDALLTIGATYQVIVRDGNNCTSPAAYSLSINSKVIVQSVAFNKCFPAGTINTSATVVPSGGDGGPYQISFDNGSTYEVSGSYTKTLPIDASYSIVVKDNSGCISMSTNIQIPASLSASLTSAVYSGGFNVSCEGNSDGSITTLVAGGTQPLSFSWTEPGAYTSNMQSISGIAAGNYTVTVTDINGCSISSNINLDEPDMLDVAAISPSLSGGFNITCNGANNGSIDLTVSGGDSTTYSYNWTGPNGFTSTSDSLQGLDAGTYNIVVTDANGCTANDNIIITEPEPLTVNAISPVVSGGFNISCNGSSNGSIDLNLSGGDSTTYSYNWSGPAGFTSTSNSLQGLDAGTYNLVLTDSNGCSASTSITLAKPDPIAINFSPGQFNATNISCKGANDGAITLNVTGGDSSTYFFAWSGPNGFTSDAAIINNLYAGTYNVSVMDSNGCGDSSSVTLIQPDSLLSFAAVSSNYNGSSVSCRGSADGMADLTITGGTLPYSYSWSNSATTENLQGIAAGNYTVIITDANGCQSNSAVTLTEPQPILGTTIINHVVCNGFSTGSIDLTISGGAAPYNYLWTSGETSEDIFNHTSGVYSVTVTDNNLCTYILNASINEESPVILSMVSTNETCLERNDGTAQAIVTGGVMPYTFIWSNGMNDANVSGLDGGAYIVTVTDSNNCFRSDTITITQPDSLVSSISSPLYINGHNVTHFQSSDGTIEMNVNGGTTPYSYSWNNGFSIQSVVQIPAGVYNVSITDSNGCMTTASITLTQPDDLAMPTGFSPNGDGKNDNFLVRGLEAFPDNKIIVVNRWGSTVFKTDPYRNDWNGINSSGEELPDGTYFVVLTINGGDIILKGYVDVRR